MKQETSRASKGFSLIETIIALFVLTLGVVGAFVVISQTIRISPSVRQEIVAANLAQEGIEIIRNIRDNTLLQIADQIKQGVAVSHTWEEEFQVCIQPFKKRIELNDKTDIASGWSIDNGCAVPGNRMKVFVHPASGFYANLCGAPPSCSDGWNDSGFRRLIDFIKLPGGCAGNACAEVQVKVKVFWNTDTEPTECPGPSCIILEDRLTNWVDYLGSVL